MATNAVRATAKVGKNPESIVLLDKGNEAFVANDGSGSMTGIATTSGATVGTVRVPGQPSLAAVSPDGKTLVIGASAYQTIGNGIILPFGIPPSEYPGDKKDPYPWIPVPPNLTGNP